MAANNKEKYGQAFYEISGPTLLSQQPDDVGKKKGKGWMSKEDWQILQNHLQARQSSLRNWRQSWWNQNYSQLAEYILPRRSIWFTQSAGGLPTPNNMTRGRPINGAIVDPAATYAARICAGGLMSGLASPSRPWFKIGPATSRITLDAEARAWLDEVEDRMYNVIAGTNFYNSFATECEDLVVFGTSVMIIYEDEKDLFRCYTPAIGEYYLASGANLRVDGLYRSFVMTISQIVDFFKLENCPPDVQQLWKQKGSGLDIERIVSHSIEPNYAVDGKVGVVPGNFTWREVYWVYGASSEYPLSVRGFIDQPFMASRWTVQSNDAYGRSVGMDVLPDVMQLQVMTRRLSEAVEKLVRPPLLAGMELKNQPASALPGHVTYTDNVRDGGMKPIYTVNPEVREMAEWIKEIQARIAKGFYNDLFLMLSDNAGRERVTAYEIAQRMQEKMAVLGPVLESILGDLKLKLKRIFQILKRRDILPPPPDSLRGVPLDIDFVSMLALSQKAAATGGMERLIEMSGKTAALAPGSLNNIDFDSFLQEYSMLLGNPQKIMRGPKAVAQLAAQQQKQAQQANAMNAANHMAQTAQVGAQAAQVASQVPTGQAGENLLSSLVGQGGG